VRESRIKKSLRNIIWAVVNKVAIIIMPFIVRTVLIYKLGAEYTGLSGLFTSILTMLSLAELGFSNAMVYCMYEPIHKKDTNTICALLNFYKKIYRIIGFFILIIGIILAPFINNFINGSIPENINIYLLYLIYLTNTVLSYFLFAYKSSLLTAYQRSDEISKIGLTCNLVLYGFQIIVLFFTRNFYLYALLLPLSTVAMNIAYEVFSRKLFPDIACKGEIDKQLKKKIKKRVIGIMLYKISSTTRTSFDSIIISAFLGLVILTQYQNYFMIISSVLGILTVIGNAITASVGDSIVAKTTDENYKDFKKFLFIYMWVAGICAVCILCLIQPFMQVWVGKDLMLDVTMAILFCAYFYIQTMGDMVFVYRTAAGLWWEDRIRPVVEAFANIALNLLFVKFFGLYGIIFATIVTLLGINFVWGAHILFKHYFKRGMFEYIKFQVLQMVITTIACVVCFLLCGGVGTNIFGFMIVILLCVVITNGIFYICHRKTDMFKEAKTFFLRMIRVLKLK